MELLRRLSVLLMLVTVVSCGGGGDGLSRDGNGGGDDGGGNNSTITVSLSSTDTNVTGQAPITVTATVLENSQPKEGELVTFTTTLGALSPTSGTARTNADGVADIVLTAGSVRGAGEVTATLNSGESASLTFSTQGDDIGVVGDINISVALVDAQGNPTDSITASKPAKAIATVNGISAPVIVTFNASIGDLPIPTAITDANNQASVDLFAGNSLGAGTITASIASGESGQEIFVIGSTNVLMGSGEPFVEGVAAIDLAGSLSAGGTAVISVNIIDEEGNPFTEAIDVNFTSGCASLPTPTALISSPINTSNGTASTTYLAQGCVGDDTINVTANAGGINLSASAVINVLPANVGSIEFESATPENISLLGTGALGGSESATVVFKVLDTNGDPVNGQQVDFSLNTDVGNVSISPTSATTNAQGLVQTVVNSGTVATTVRVQAVIAGSDPQITSQSSLLVVSTGIPDQDSFSLSADVLNPEAWIIDGTQVVVTARLADAFNNPVPDGTAVSFTTEGGSIDPACTTVNGSCSVNWYSQFPRPEGKELAIEGRTPEIVNTMGQKYGGRATILATAIGEESFPDLNGNGRFDASEQAAFTGTDISGFAYDLKEAFVDHNEDGLYSPVEAGAETGGEIETFVDFDNSQDFTVNDGKYNGVLCAIPAHDGCSTQKSINVRKSLVLVMSGSSANFVTLSTTDAVVKTIDDDNDPNTPEVANPNYDPNDDTVYIAGENVGSASVIIADLHNQPMPAGSEVRFNATVGSVQGTSSFTWPNDNHNGGAAFGVSIKGENEPKTGTLLIEVETPSGTVTTYNAITIVIQ
ncbi:hypothetical protein LP316_09825 [Thalassotalea sp. LPB0316]|uniref:hypothetical protein n=1 Tax=Thalassotalea sp. LPB0316 TaxID=2769490 RepID=UPI001867CF9A|nr:hypothetical protein [Thalassotalea sp. LPB0316]QOL24642.1 hypothetical protein LP316_09825 [Thalassotalea sp. LPB0316]